MNNMQNSDPRWQFWIDRGGTFTDIVARSPEGKLLTHKLLSENPECYQDAALQGIRDVLKLPDNEPLAGKLDVVKMGTTVGTNALLERKGEPTALLITAGLKDCLKIGYQNRPDIFALNIHLPEQLYQTVIEINERINAAGDVLIALDKKRTKQQLQSVYDRGFRSIAIVLMHAWCYPNHEQILEQLAEAIGFSQISVSSKVSPLMKIVSRGDTTVVDAYLSPLLRRYVDHISIGLQSQQGSKQGITAPRLLFMQSNGGLTEATSFQGKDSILSGPAGGMVGAVATSVRAGFEKIIAFDMGGTSTDVAHYAGEFERSFETEVAGVRMRAPMMNIHTVAAGGGSILYFDGIRYRVGPDSAGANPGPASYRRGGPLTVTDANVMLGKLPLFPAVFGKNGDLSLDVDRARELFSQLGQNIRNETGDNRTPEQVAEGFLTIAVENMADAIKKISVQKGYDVSQYTLCCYGAASGQHACKVADRLGMKRIILHPFAGVLSAYGMGLADFRLLKDKALERPWQDISEQELQIVLAELESQGIKEMQTQGVDRKQIKVQPRLHLRYIGTDTSLQVDFTDRESMLEDFQKKYQQQFGFIYTGKPLILETATVEVIGVNEQLEDLQVAYDPVDPCQPVLNTRLFSENTFHDTPVFQRGHLAPGATITGPAIIIEQTSTTVIEPGWQAEVSALYNLILSRIKPLPNRFALGTTADPVILEIFNKLFMSIAEQMGFVLQNTAYSVNIKERLDFSCAIFDSRAQLIANAPHIPVHLGSMGESVLALCQVEQQNMQPGDVFLLNSPYQGGTHLPDITVVTPVFGRNNNELLFFVASRGHHADVGGITPGSMPPGSQRIDEEGLLSSGFKIVAAGQFQEEHVRTWLASGKYPARNPEQNIADLQAQIAANRKGMQELLNMVDSYSLPTVEAYMQHVQDNAEAAVRSVLQKLSGGQFVYQLDDGAKIAVSIEIDQQQRTARIDFTGTTGQLENNFNAPSAVCKAAVLYVFRTLVQDDIPLNSGCLKPLEIIIPEGSMLNPEYPAAVVAGNVETSQYIVDALYGALGVMAASQGTMNNFTFGNEDYQYYETICGGAGAGAEFAGCDAVHTHMTNSRITDPEVLEWRFPIMLEEFSIRTASGGSGRNRGGDGVTRRLKFLKPMTASILSSHRKLPPFGMKGGSAGKTGRNSLQHEDGSIETLPACIQVEVKAGESIQIETPGGGGFGKEGRDK